MNTNSNELWLLLKSEDLRNLVFKSPERISFSINVASGNLIAVFCFDEFGKYQRAAFSKQDFIRVMDVLLVTGELLPIIAFARILRDRQFSDDEITFLLPVAYYVSEAALDKEHTHDIVQPKNDIPGMGAYEDYATHSFSNEPEVVTEEAIAENEISPNVCRSVYIHPRIVSQYRKAPKNIKEEIDNAIRDFSSMAPDAFMAFLKQNHNKRLRGSKNKIDKIYVNKRSGNRLLWCTGKDVDSRRYGNSILLLDYVVDHERQGKAANCVQLTIDFELAAEKMHTLAEKAKDGFEEAVPPYKYTNGLFIPSLSGLQQTAANVSAPALIMGCAGSGKTVVSVAVFCDLLALEKEPYYITYNNSLVLTVRQQLIDRGCDKKYVYAHVMNTVEFCVQQLKKSSIEMASYKLITFEDFSKWKRRTFIKKAEKNIRQIDDYQAWTYIRGVIKGGAIAENYNDVREETFLHWMQQNEGIDTEHAHAIFAIAQKYLAFCGAENKLDDNDLAALLEKTEPAPSEKTVLLIDEAQDLTYTQIAAFRGCVCNNQQYLFGDNNQRINPTIIDLESIGRLYYDDDRANTMQIIPLGSTFRVGDGVGRLINHLAELRREKIALQGQSSERKEMTSSDRDIGMWAIFCLTQKIAKGKLCNISADASNCIVVVPNLTSKEELIAGNSVLCDRVKTIFEIKGLEYDNIILVDFVSANIQTFRSILNGEMKRNTFGRLLFNMLYVSCSRARERLVIYESLDDDPIMDIIYKDVIKATSQTEITRYMYLDDDDEGWLNEARRLEEIEDYRSAIFAYGHVRSMDVAYDIGRCRIMLTLCDRRASGLLENPEWLISAVEDLVKNGDYALAERLAQENMEKHGPRSIPPYYLEALRAQNKPIRTEDILNFVASPNFELYFETQAEAVDLWAETITADNKEKLETVKNIFERMQ